MRKIYSYKYYLKNTIQKVVIDTLYLRVTGNNVFPGALYLKALRFIHTHVYILHY